MAKMGEIAELAKNGGEMVAGNTLQGLLARVDIKKRFEEILGKKAAGFMSSLLSLTNTDANLKACEPRTILSAAMMAATLDLPVNKNLGFAWIIPYKGKAEFQMGYKGFVQLGIRTGQYKTMNASEIYADEIKTWNPITGEIEFTEQSAWKQRAAGETDKIIGYVAFFKLLNGFEKYLYMTTGQMERHAKRYAQSYDNPRGKWKTDKQAMSLKTVLKLLLSKYGILSIEMQRAIAVDQGVLKDVETVQDAQTVPEAEFVDAQEIDEPNDAQEELPPIPGTEK